MAVLSTGMKIHAKRRLSWGFISRIESVNLSIRFFILYASSNSGGSVCAKSGEPDVSVII